MRSLSASLRDIRSDCRIVLRSRWLASAQSSTNLSSSSSRGRHLVPGGQLADHRLLPLGLLFGLHGFAVAAAQLDLPQHLAPSAIRTDLVHPRQREVEQVGIGLAAEMQVGRGDADDVLATVV